MSESMDCKQSDDSLSRKRCPLSDRDESGPTPSKSTKVEDSSSERPLTSQSCISNEVETKGTIENSVKAGQGESCFASDARMKDSTSTDHHNSGGTAEAHLSDLDLRGSRVAQVDAGRQCPPSTSMDQSDSAAIAAAEALASLTGRDGVDSEEAPCLSNKVKRDEKEGKVKLGVRNSSKESLKTLAAAADSSTSVRSVGKEDVEFIPDAEEGDGSSPGSSSTSSSSFPSDNEDDDDDDDGECAIVSVKMAPEIRQSVALLAQVQMRIEALEKKSARLHHRLDMKMSRLRRPHLDQRSTIAQSIPGFWVTALLNHPHLSAHIDETDEDALSYMIDLEIESFKNNKLGYRIRFHFRRNPYFQNNVIMKEVHLGIGGSPVSFSNPILWHRGQNLTAHREPRRTRRGVYQTFFSWFSDHSNPGRDDIAQILKDDLYRDPLRYYLTPLWEPRENGSGTSGARPADNSNGEDCVVISDSDEEHEHSDPGVGHSRGEEEEEEDDEEDDYDDDEEKRHDEASDDGDEEPREGEEEDSFGEKDEDVYVEDVAESSVDQKAKDREDEEDVDIDEEGDDEEERKA